MDNDGLSKRGRQFARATLPLGIVFAAFVLLRVILAAMGTIDLHPVDVIFTFIQGALAAMWIWQGWVYRRTGRLP